MNSGRSAGRPRGLEPANKGRTLPGTKKPARASSVLVRQFFDRVDASGLSAKRIGAVAGVHHVTLSRWRHGVCAPALVDFENAAQALGYRLVLAPLILSSVDGQQSTKQAD